MDNLTADDILNENGNTLKTGLEIAGRTVTIDILNTTFPREDLQAEQDQGAQEQDLHLFREHHPNKRRYGGHNGGNERRERKLEDFYAAMERGMASTFGHDTALTMLDSSKDVWSPRVQDLQNRHLETRSRRLVFYTDEYPSEVVDIIELDNPIIENRLCEEGANCMIVQQISCVVLEEGDNEFVVRLALQNGLRQAVNNGDFAAAIPPEHIP